MPTRTRQTPRRILFGAATSAVVAGLLAVAGASGSSSSSFSGGPSGADYEPAQSADFEWVEVTYGAGTRVDVAVFKPESYSDSGRHPLILALPWGGGTPELALGMVDAYWNREAPLRGYVVIAPAILGSSLATEAAEFLPALFSWLDEHVSYDPERVVVVGASNGGRGVFHVLTADPERFAAAIAMPGSYSGPAERLEPFVGKPVWLMVGEMDQRWRASTEATRAALEAAGTTPRVNLIRGQGHVLRIDDRMLMDWLAEVLAGS
ncbi:MAG: prolyl oligopeptidase family serine peptidase [Gemmatimonadetes bacterium]|nr:prolyl oligopeptidase family serine peptidase [Gemmatimonadota bacterium]MCH8812288.1 prolyl oligopeptidase family serine peptidase [Gemmatimonadota bacterium]